MALESTTRQRHSPVNDDSRAQTSIVERGAYHVDSGGMANVASSVSSAVNAGTSQLSQAAIYRSTSDRNRLSPTSPESNSLEAGIPRTTLRTTLGFTAGPVTFVNFVNHRSGVTAPFATPTGTAVYKSGGYTTVDLRLSVRLPSLAFGRGVELGLQVNDLFDATPPFFPGTDGIGGAYNAIGRYAALSLRTSF